MISFCFEKTLKLPEVVVKDYLNECSELELKTLLLLIYSSDLNPLQIAQRLGSTANEVEKAIDFWVRREILRHSKTEEELEQPQKSKLCQLKLTSKEAVKMISESESLSFVMEQLPDLLNRLANQFDVVNLVDLHFNLGMEPELIMLLLKYCATIGQTSARAIKKEAAFWFECGINSYESAETYIARNNELEHWHSEVKEKLGLATLNNRQKLIIKKWKTEMKLDLNAIEQAIDTALIQKGEINIAYVNGILVNRAKGMPRKFKQTSTRKVGYYGEAKRNEFSSFRVEDL
ncbi:MAG: DnaD domain protein [Oscillospiraceae bacterium]|jgi:replication initiation and membrane attachment protein DnaB|nr:DnaD domain protein [Oscillospiraceae bacterium]